ncbi:MAG: hypothetical protein ACTSU5_18925 [Promethearchaeota archaeon]
MAPHSIRARLDAGWWMLLGVAVFIAAMCLVGFAVKVMEEYQWLTFAGYFTRGVFTRKNYTLVGTLTDFDRQLGDIRYNSVVALVLSGWALLFGVDPRPGDGAGETRHERGDGAGLGRWLALLGCAVAAMVVFLVLASAYDLGWSWRELDGRDVLLLDFDDGYFSSKLLPFGVFFAGSGFPFLWGRCHLGGKRMRVNSGLAFAASGVLVFTVLAVAHPVYQELLVGTEAVGCFLSLVISNFTASGVLLVIQSRRAGGPGSLNRATGKSGASFARRPAFLQLATGACALAAIGVLMAVGGADVYLDPGAVLLALPSAVQVTLLSVFFYFAGLYIQSRGGPNARDPGDDPGGDGQ